MAKEGSAEATIRNVKRKTRRKYSAEEKIRIVVEGLRGELTIAELYRLGSPFAEDFAGVQYVSKDHMSGVLFAFLLHRLDPVTPLILYPRGLVPDRRYTIEGYPDARSGAAWVNTGVGRSSRQLWQHHSPDLGRNVVFLNPYGAEMTSEVIVRLMIRIQPAVRKHL